MDAFAPGLVTGAAKLASLPALAASSRTSRPKKKPGVIAGPSFLMTTAHQLGPSATATKAVLNLALAGLRSFLDALHNRLRRPVIRSSYEVHARVLSLVDESVRTKFVFYFGNREPCHTRRNRCRRATACRGRCGTASDAACWKSCIRTMPLRTTSVSPLPERLRGRSQKTK